MLDLAIVAAFVIYSVATGFAMRKKASRGPEEYFLAGRSLKGWQAGISMAATQYAADTPLLVTGLVATAGIFALWRLWVYALAFLVMGFMLGGPWRRARVLTDPEFTEIRYGGGGALVLRALKAFYLGTVVNCTVLAMVLLAATRITEPFLIWHEWLPSWLYAPFFETVKHLGWVLTSFPSGHPDVWIYSADNFISILAIVSFTALYSMTGGLRSVVATDVVQFAIMMIATAIYAFIIVSKVGGISALSERLVSLYGERAQDILSWGPARWSDVSFIFVLVLGVQWFAQVNADGSGYLAQRTMACRTDKDARAAALVFTAAQILLRSLLWLPIVLGLLVLYPAGPLLGGDSSEAFRVFREKTFAMGIKDFLPPGLQGLMLTGMLAALASTVDTHLNWGASYWTNDLYHRVFAQKIQNRAPRTRELMWVARLSNVGILIISLVVMSRIDSIQSAWHLSLLFGSGLGAVLILRWVWHRINLWSEIFAIVSSLTLAPILLFGFPGMEEGLRLVLMAGITTVGVIAVTLLTPPEHKDVLADFYDRTRPCGFWGPVARLRKQSGYDPQRDFFRGLFAVIVCAASLFCLLIGIGRLLTSPAPFPKRSLVLIVCGLSLIPFWWKLGFAHEPAHQTVS